jgi:hypothetical protein
MMYGPLAALYSELFSTGNRYTGASLGYQLAGLGAGFAPLIFAELQRANGGGSTTPVSWTIAAFCVLSAVCVLALRETHRRDLTPDLVPDLVPDLAPAVPAPTHQEGSR